MARRARPRTFLDRLVSNTLVGLGGTVLQKALAFATTLLLTRGLGDEGFGIYSYVVSYMFLVSFLSDLGMERVVTREVGNAPHRAPQLVGNAVLLKLGLSAAAVVVALSGARLLKVPSEVWYCVVPAAIGLPFSIELVFRGFIQTRYAMKYSFAVNLPGSLAFLAIAGLCVWLGWPVYTLFYGALVIGAITVLCLLALLRWRLHLRLSLQPRWGEIGALMRDSWQVGAFGLLLMLAMRVDQLMLFHLRSADAVGVYAAGVRVSEALGLVPDVLLLTLFPLLVSTQRTSPERFRHTYRLGFKYLGASVVPLALALTVFRREVVASVFGTEYIPGSDALAVLAWNMFFGYTGAVYLNLFIAQARQGLLLAVSLLALAINIVLNLAWIPAYGPTGAAVATLAANGAGFCCWCAVPATRPYMVACVQEVWRCLLAGAAVVALLLALSLGGVSALLVIVGVYPVLLWTMGGAAWSDIALVRRLFAESEESEGVTPA